MSKIKEFLKGIVSNYKNSFKQYTATNIIILLTTLFLVFALENLPTITDKLLTVIVICAVNFFTCETYFKKMSQRGIAYIVSIGVAIGLEKLMYTENLSAVRFGIGYIIIVFLIGVIQVIRNSEVDVGEYVVKTFKNLFGVGIIYSILNIGLTLILFIFIALILNDTNNFNLIGRLQIALLGLWMLPASLVAITDVKNEVSKFIKAIILYIMLPLTILATAIIYMYMAKIIIIREIPANSIFRILAGLFIVAFPVWTAIHAFREEAKIIEKFCKILPISFIPFVLLQIYSIYARIDGNGLTPSRYIGIMFIVFEIIAIFLSLYKERKYLIHTITAVSVIIAISTMLPIVNVQSASNISQSNRLKKAWRTGQSFDELSDENKEIAKSAYDYLKRQNDSDKYIPNYVSEDEMDKSTKDNRNYYNDYVQYKNVEYSKSYGKEEPIIPIGGYRYLQAIAASEYNQKLENFRNIKFIGSVTINLEEYISKVIEENNEKGYVETNNVIKIDENRDFYITNLRMRYTDQKPTKISYFIIKGYVLQK